MLEFLDLKDYPALHESNIEQALIDHLQQFLLELGRGFCFVGRQRRMRYDDEDFYVDLVKIKKLIHFNNILADVRHKIPEESRVSRAPPRGVPLLYKK